MDKNEKLYTINDIASMLTVTTRTIHNYLKSGILTGRKIGGQWRFTESNISELLNSTSYSTPLYETVNEEITEYINKKSIDPRNKNGCEICSVIYLKKQKNEIDILLENIKNDKDRPKKYSVNLIREYDNGERIIRLIIYGDPLIIYNMMKQIDNNIENQTN